MIKIKTKSTDFLDFSRIWPTAVADNADNVAQKAWLTQPCFLCNIEPFNSNIYFNLYQGVSMVGFSVCFW